jgi:hypothetical protein
MIQVDKEEFTRMEKKKKMITEIFCQISTPAKIDLITLSIQIITLAHRQCNHLP